jgi:uracil-DNA glycosylase
MQLPPLPPAWAAAIGGDGGAAALAALAGFLDREVAAGHRIFPPPADRFRALELTAPDAVRVVILGQDPYHRPGQAHGLSFSVGPGVRVPPSLRNIQAELAGDLGLAAPGHGTLAAWARQGVLLLNAILTVREGAPLSHAQAGWQALTDALLVAAARVAPPAAFLLWGGPAGANAAAIEAAGGGRHLILKSPHPSPLSAYRGFFGSRPFSRANAWLAEQGRQPVDWRLPPPGGGC